MFSKEINFDRFARGLIFACVCVAGYFLATYLSPVLLPFVVAWVLAYILSPLVEFLQYKCHLRFRMLCVILTLVIVIGAIGGMLYMFIPRMVGELLHLKDVAIAYISGGAGGDSLPRVVRKFLEDNADKIKIERILSEKDLLAGSRWPCQRRGACCSPRPTW